MSAARLAPIDERLHLSAMLTIQLDPGLEEGLRDFAEKTGRSATECVSEAVREYLEDLHDIEIADARLRSPGKTFSAEEVKRELGLSL